MVFWMENAEFCDEINSPGGERLRRDGEQGEKSEERCRIIAGLETELACVF
jgi:hypothetical protein